MRLYGQFTGEAINDAILFLQRNGKHSLKDIADVLGVTGSALSNLRKLDRDPGKHAVTVFLLARLEGICGGENLREVRKSSKYKIWLGGMKNLFGGSILG